MAAVAASVETAVRLGERIDGRYRVIDLIADGGMGTVFLAEHTLIKRRVALKVLHQELAHDVMTVHHFFNEATAAGTLGHPHIVESTDMGHTDNGVPYIVFELLEGPLLSAEIERSGGLPTLRAVRIARQIASALQAAHEAGIVHLDLKSENVFLVERDGMADHVKVIDFGIACYLDRDRHKSIAGTPAYMAPEQICAPESVDQRTDIYALGVVIYEMLTGRCPFEDEDQGILMRRILVEAPPQLYGGSLPTSLAALVHAMMAKQPAHRPPSMAAVIAVLDKLVVEEEDESDYVPTTALPVISEPAELPVVAKRGWPTGLLAGAMFAAALGLVATTLVHRRVENLHAIAVRSLQEDVANLSATLDTQMRDLQQRASIIAATPVLRSAIARDPATLAELANHEHVLDVRPDESIALYQRSATGSTEILRMPYHAKPLQRGLHLDGSQLVASALQPVKAANAEMGDIAVAAPLALDAIRTRFAGDAISASLHGFERPLDLVTGTEDGEQLELPVALGAGVAGTRLSLHAKIRTPDPGLVLEVARFASFALASVLAVAFIVIGIRRSRDRSG